LYPNACDALLRRIKYRRSIGPSCAGEHSIGVCRCLAALRITAGRAGRFGAEPARLGQVCFNYVLFNHLLACGWALLAFAEGFDASWVRLLPAPYILNHDLSKHGGKWER
jgi:hypothetical protein